MHISLLVVSPSHSIREMLARYLTTEQFTVFTADSIQLALNYIQTLPLDAVVTELNLGDASGLDLLVWLNQHYPKIHPVIMCESDDTELFAFLRTQGATYLGKNKMNLFSFRNILLDLCQYQRGVNYQFNQISLFEMVHLASRSNNSRHVYITSPQTGQEGLIYFEKAQVKHALFDTFEGEAAFYEIMRMKQGLFSEMEVGNNAYYTINSSLDQLMAISALKIDQDEALEIPPTHCTILSPDMAFGDYFIEAYPTAELELACTDDPTEALKQLQIKSDLLILDLDTVDLNPNDFLTQLDDLHLKTRIIMVGSRLDSQLNYHLAHANVDRFFLKPMQFKELGELINQTYLSQQFNGRFFDLPLANVLQTFSYFRQPRLLEVKDFFSGMPGQIFLSNGEIQHATLGNLSGRDALKAMLQIRYGLFRQETYWEPTSRSLNVPFSRLMLYLTRYIDELAQPVIQNRDILLQNGQVITIQPEKINYVLAMEKVHASAATREAQS